MAVAAFPSCGARRLNARPWLHAVRSSASSPYPSPSHPRCSSDVDGLGTAPISTAAPSRSFFPKRGQTLELVCESLAFKGKGVCKVTTPVSSSCATAPSPASAFLAAYPFFLSFLLFLVCSSISSCHKILQVTKLKTITPHWDLVEAPCRYASDCGGCKTQNLTYEAQLRAKEQQVHDLIVHVGRFSG